MSFSHWLDRIQARIQSSTRRKATRRRRSQSGQHNIQLPSLTEQLEDRTLLTVGVADIAVVGWNSDGGDDWAIVTLRDIPANEVVFFTDRGWQEPSNTFTNSTFDTALTWTVDADGVPAGTFLSNATLTTQGTVSGSLSFDSGGDQLLIYQTADDMPDSLPPTFIYAFNNNNFGATNGWQDSDAVGGGSSSVPEGLTAVTTSGGAGSAFGLLNEAADNYRYDGPTTDADKATWLSRIHTTGNWTSDDTNALDVSPTQIGNPNTAGTVVVTDAGGGNTAPTVSSAPTDITVTEDTSSNVDLSTTLFTDADGDNLTVTLSINSGTFGMPADGAGVGLGVTETLVNSTTITLNGVAADINTYLDTASNIQYTGASNVNGNDAATLTITPNDGTADGVAAMVNIDITAVNDAPVLDSGQTPTLTTINEDAGDDDGSGADGDDDATNNANNGGDTVAAIVVDASITDVDGVAVEAIAVTIVDNTNGVWQYSLDGGSSWNNFSGTTGSSVDISSSARLLNPTHRIRFVPDSNYSGTATFTFRAWDQSSGTGGGTANASSGGGSTAFSMATDTTSITVSAVNDAPSFSGLDGTPTFNQGGSPVTLDSDVTVSDIELDPLNAGNGDYSGASLVIARNGGANADDTFSFDTSGALFTVSGSNLQSGGQTFATFNNGSGTLTVNYTSSSTTATSALVNNVMQHIQYSNANGMPPATVQLDWTFSDGTDSDTGSSTVSIPALPTTSVTISGGTLTITDVDGGTSNDALTISYSGGTYTITDSGGLILDASTISGSTGSGTAMVTLPDTGVTGINFDVLGGNDSVMVTSLQAAALSNGFTIAGGAGTDSATLDTAIDATGGAVSIAAETINLSGGVTSAGDQTYNGAVVLAASITMTSTSGDIDFGSTVSADGAGRDLTVSALAGNVNFDGAVADAGGANIDDLDVDAATMSVSTTGGTFSTTRSINLNDVGILNIDASTTFTTADASGGAFTSAQNVVAVTGDETLTVDADAAVTIHDGTIASLSVTDATTVTFSGDLITSGTVTVGTSITGDVNVSSVASIQSAGTVSIDNTAGAGSSDIIVDGSITVTGSAGIDFDADDSIAVGLGADGLATSQNGDIDFNGAGTTIRIGDGGNTGRVVTTGMGNIILSSAVGSFNMANNTAGTFLSSGGSVDINATTNATIAGAGIVAAGSIAIDAQDTITLNSEVRSTASTTAITATDTDDDNTATIIVNANVSGTTATLTATDDNTASEVINVTAATENTVGSTIFEAGNGTVNLSGGVTSVGDQTYNGATSIGANNTVLNSTAGGTIEFNSTLAAGANNISIVADEINFNGNVSGSGSLTLAPNTTSTTIGVGGGTGTLDLSDAELAFLQDGFSSITIGDATAGDIDIDSATFSDPVTLVTNGEIHDNAGTDIDAGANTVTADGTVAPGQSPGILAIAGNFMFADNSTFEVEIGGTSPGTASTDHDQVDATGSVSIGTGVTLDLVDFNGFGATITGGESFKIINRTGGTGTFNGLAEGATISNFLGSGLDATITYAGGDGNDVVIDIIATTVTVVGGDLIIDDATGNADNQITVVIDGANYRISDAGARLAAGAGATADGDDILIPIASVTGSIQVITQGGNDTLEVDFSGGNPIPAGGLTFDGGMDSGGGDELIISGNATPFSSQTFNYDNTVPADGFGGNVVLDDGLATRTITYTGLEPVTGGTSVNTTINLPTAVANDATLQNNATSGFIEIIDNGATFEDTTFPNPTGSLTVNLGDNGDSLAINVLDPGFAATLTINGGSGDDTFAFNDGVALDFSINGGAQSTADTVTFAASTSGVSVDVSRLTGIEALVGSGNSDTLVGTSGDDIFDVTAANSGTINTSTAFASFENLTGAGGNDQFLFEEASSRIDGNVDGQAGTDTLSYADNPGGFANITLNGIGTSGYGGIEAGLSSLMAFSNVDSLVATSSGNDFIGGLNLASTWVVTDTTGSYAATGGSTLNLSAFELYSGGSAADTFNVSGTPTANLSGQEGDDAFIFATGASVTGTIFGGTDNDTLSFAASTTDVTVSLTAVNAGDGGFNGTTGLASGGFQSIDTVAGGTGDDTLNGLASTAGVWTVDATNTYVSTNTLQLSGMENLTGSSAADTFNVTPSLTTAINILGGNPATSPGDTLNFTSPTGQNSSLTPDGIDGGTFSTTGGFQEVTYDEIEELIFTGDDTLTVNGTDQDDRFDLTLTGPGTGTLEMTVDVDGTPGPTVSFTIGFSGIQRLVANGGDNNDVFRQNNTGGPLGLTNGIEFNGEAGSDSLEVLNGTATTVAHVFTNANDGSMSIDAFNLVYTGLEPILDTITATDRTFTFNNTDDDITLSDLGGGQSRIESVSSSETVDFTNPTGSLTINAGDGADTVDASASAVAVTINGGDGADEISGTSLPDVINGDAGNDTITGNAGNDVVDGGADDDLLIWNNGDGSDTFDGGDGTDELEVNGSTVSPAGDTITVSANGARFDLTRADGGAGLGPFSLDVGTVETLDLNTLDGDDSVTVADLTGVADLATLQIDAGAGNDRVDASALPDLGLSILLEGGNDNDTITGAAGPSMINGNMGNDSLIGGAAADTIMGGGGDDVMNGGAGGDMLSGQAGDDTLTGGLGDDTLNGGANADRIVESRDADFDLGDATLTISPAETDALVDIEEADLDGGASANTIDASDFSGTVTLMGGDGNDTITGAQGSSVINGNMGNDNLTGLDADDTIMGGGNDDILNGGGGADMLTGQAGNDTLTGGTGNDTMNGGDNDDLLVWNNGDGSDQVDGGADTDELEVNGSTVTPTGDDITVSANGARFDLTRADGGAGLGPFSLDVGTIETLDLNTFAGNDNVTINDLTGVANLASIQVEGGDGNDTIDASALPNLGLNVLLEGGNDNDTITGSAGPSAINGNMGNDSLIGGAAADTIMGGGGDDIMNGGAGGDMLTGQAGDDTMTGGTGDDTMNGGTDTDRIAETRDADFDLGDTSLTISPAETDTLMDIEQADLTGGASANTIDASDFSGTATLMGGDSDDTITGAQGASMINGNMGNDSLLGLGAADGIMGGGGNDFIDGGAGNDTLTGQANDDTITGNIGDDNIMGGDGNDLINGSLGNDTISGDAGNDRIQGSNLSDYPGMPQMPITDLNTINMSDRDSLLGGAGSDTIAGAIGADFIDGGADADVIDAQSGGDTTNGIDTIVGDMADSIFRDPEDTVL